MLVKFENGMKDVDILNVTPENYIVPENERHLYHCKIEIRQFNAKTGARQSRPRIQKFGKKMFETNIQHNLPKQGYVVEVLYNPNPYLIGLDEQKKQSAAKAKAAQDAKIQAQIDAAVEAALEKKERKTRSKKDNNEQ